jgi:hypothetical protein
MQFLTRIPEVARRDRFIKSVLSASKVSIVAGDQGWACVPFKQDPARDVVLVWSATSEAERWASIVATNPTVHDISLATLLSDVLPMLANRRCLIGPDWSTDPADPIVDCADLVDRIWRDRNEQFVARIRDQSSIWVLESASGPAYLPSTRADGRQFMPVWASRDDAASNAAGSWAVKRPIAVSLEVFRDRYLPYLDQRGWFVGPEPIPGAGARELAPAELANRLFPVQTLARLRAV